MTWPSRKCRAAWRWTARNCLCVLANWETTYIDEWKTYVRARAYENAVFVAAANRVGEDVTMNFGGESMIVGPRGKVYAWLETEPVAEEAKPEAKPEAKEEKKTSETEAKKEAEVKVEAEAKKDGEAAPAADAKKAAEAKPPEPKAESKKGAHKAEVKKPTPVEGYCVARIDLDEVRHFREEFQTLQSRKPTVYRPVVRKY